MVAQPYELFNELFKAALYTIVPRSSFFLLFVLQNIAGYKNDIKCG